MLMIGSATRSRSWFYFLPSLLFYSPSLLFSLPCHPHRITHRHIHTYIHYSVVSHPGMLQNQLYRQSLVWIGVQHGHNQITRGRTGFKRKEPIRPKHVGQIIFRQNGVESSHCRRTPTTRYLAGFCVPLAKGLVPRTPQQVLAKGKRPKEHGVQNDACTPHIRLGAVVAQFVHALLAFLVGLGNDFGGHVVW